MNKKEKLKLILDWLYKFPCNKYFDEPSCILEFIDEEDMLKFIEEQYKEYQETPFKPLTDKEIKELGL